MQDQHQIERILTALPMNCEPATWASWLNQSGPTAAIRLALLPAGRSFIRLTDQPEA